MEIKQDKELYYLKEKKVKSIKNSFIYKNELIYLIEKKKGSILLTKNNSFEFSEKIKKSFFFEKEDILILIQKKHIIVFSLKIFVVMNKFVLDLNFDFERQNIFLGNFTKKEFYLLIKNGKKIFYFHFDFFEIFFKEILFDNFIDKIFFTDNFIIFGFLENIIYYDIYFENKKQYSLKNNNYFFFENLLIIKNKKNIDCVDFPNFVHKIEIDFHQKDYFFKNKLLIKENLLFFEKNDKIFFFEKNNKILEYYAINLKNEKNFKCEIISKNIFILKNEKNNFYFSKSKENILNIKFKINNLKKKLSEQIKKENNIKVKKKLETEKIALLFETFTKEKLKKFSEKEKREIFLKRELLKKRNEKKIFKQINNLEKKKVFDNFQKIQFAKIKGKSNNSEKCHFCENLLTENIYSKKSILKIRDNFYHDRCFLKMKKKIKN